LLSWSPHRIASDERRRDAKGVVVVIVDMEAIGAEAMIVRLRPLDRDSNTPSITNASAEPSTRSATGATDGSVASNRNESETFFEEL